MSTFSLPITPPDPSQAGFTVELRPIATGHEDPLKSDELLHGTLRYHAHLAMRILSFGSWLEPRYIFAAGQLI
jgi:hypothetical protein